MSEITRDVPSEVERIIGRCLQKSPQNRIHHTLDLKLTLEDLGRSLGSPGRGTSFASVAVLPFINMSRDEENEFLSDGITEDIRMFRLDVPKRGVLMAAQAVGSK